MSKVKTTKTKETENYTHYDLEFNFEDIDKDTLKTIHLGKGVKMVIGDNIKTGEIQGLKVLVPIGKEDEKDKA